MTRVVHTLVFGNPPLGSLRITIDADARLMAKVPFQEQVAQFSELTWVEWQRKALALQAECKHKFERHVDYIYDDTVRVERGFRVCRLCGYRVEGRGARGKRDT